MKKSIISLLLLLFSVSTYAQSNHLWNGKFWNGKERAWKFNIIDMSKKGYQVKAKLDLYQKNDDPNTNCAKIRVIEAPRNGETHAVNLSQKLFDIKKGKKYKVSFDVKSNINRQDNISVQLFSSEYTASKNSFVMCYSNKLKFQGDGEWKKLSFNFDAKAFKTEEKLDVENLKIRFCFGGRMGVYYFDNVTIERI